MILSLLFVLFVGLKITGYITVSWWIVILWLPAFLLILFIIFFWVNIPEKQKEK